MNFYPGQPGGEYLAKLNELALAGDITAGVAAAAGSATSAAESATTATTKAQAATDSAALAATGAGTATAKADIATTKALESTSAAASAISAINAPLWVSGTTYALNASATSPSSHWTYRRIIAGAGTLDPVNDPANWLKISQPQAGSGTTDAVTHNQLGSAAYADIIQIALWIAASGMGASLVKVTTATYTVTPLDTSLIVNYAGIAALTLPDPTLYPNRSLTLKTITANTVISESANVVPIIGGTASTAILAATAGKWAVLQSDGIVWQIMEQG